MKHFLLIDDDEIFAHLLQRGFSRHGLTLDWATNSDAALAYPGRPDGIILDLNLGGDSGLQLLPQLVQQFPASKIVVLTGYASISTAVSAVKLGACQYLPKPADVATLLQAFGNDNTTVAEDNQQTPIAEQFLATAQMGAHSICAATTSRQHLRHRPRTEYAPAHLTTYVGQTSGEKIGWLAHEQFASNLAHYHYPHEQRSRL